MASSQAFNMCRQGLVSKSNNSPVVAQQVNSAFSSISTPKKSVGVALKTCKHARIGRVVAAFEDQDPAAEAAALDAKNAQMEKMKADYEAAMKDPAQAAQIKAMEQAMTSPQYQQQMSAMGNYFQSPELKEKMEGLKDDPELKDFFEAIKKEGPGAMMKYWDDPVLLQKFAQKMGPPPAPTPQAPPEITTLLAACKYGDLEAVEDFLAVGKDVNETDEVGRTPLHFAAAIDHVEITCELLKAGASVDNVDQKNNTPLHYAAGYGRLDCVQILLDAGADISIENDTGKTAGALAKLEPRNPIQQSEELMGKLGVSA